MCNCTSDGLNNGNTDGSTVDLTAPPPSDFAQPAPPPDLTVTVTPIDLTSPPTQDQYIPPTDADGISCGNKTCTTGNLCCVTLGMGGGGMTSCMPSCPDASIPVACDGPGNCGGNPCCVTVQSRVVSGAACGTGPSDCAPAIDYVTQSGMDRLCHVDGDCTAGLQGPTMFPSCCSLKQQGATIHVCLNKQIAGFIGATCP